MLPDPHGSEPTTYNLLFVCTGNTCRSPMAEAAARVELERRGWTHVQVRSAGVSAQPGSAASEHAAAVVEAAGGDLSAHRSTPLSTALVDWADLILAMGAAHLQALHEYGAAEKTALITDFLGGAEAGTAVEDPFGGEQDEYRRVFDTLQRAVSALLDRLAPILAP